MSKEQKLAYVVTYGDYSDYGIAAVFDNEEAAEEYCQRMNREWSKVLRAYDQEYRIEIYGMNGGEADRVVVSVAVDMSGAVVQVENSGLYASGYFGNGKMWGSSTRGADVATKIARDYLAMYKALDTL